MVKKDSLHSTLEGQYLPWGITVVFESLKWKPPKIHRCGIWNVLYSTLKGTDCVFFPFFSFIVFSAVSQLWFFFFPMSFALLWGSEQESLISPQWSSLTISGPFVLPLCATSWVGGGGVRPEWLTSISSDHLLLSVVRWCCWMTKCWDT